MTAPVEVPIGGRRRVTLTVNGRERTTEVEPRILLVDVLRHELGLTGTHVGCEQGACGACTVLVDGAPTRSCLVLAPQADGRAIETIESLALEAAPAESAPGAPPDPRGPGTAASGATGLHAVAAAMAANHGLQCGFCTPGIVVSLVGAHRGGASLDHALGDVLDGHLCRCTGYVNIRAAVREAWATIDAAAGDAAAGDEASG